MKSNKYSHLENGLQASESREKISRLDKVHFFCNLAGKFPYLWPNGSQKFEIRLLNSRLCLSVKFGSLLSIDSGWHTGLVRVKSRSTNWKNVFMKKVFFRPFHVLPLWFCNEHLCEFLNNILQHYRNPSCCSCAYRGAGASLPPSSCIRARSVPRNFSVGSRPRRYVRENIRSVNRLRAIQLRN